MKSSHFFLSIAVLVANASLFATRDNFKTKLNQEKNARTDAEKKLNDKTKELGSFKADAEKQISNLQNEIQNEKEKRGTAERAVAGKQREVDRLNVQIKQIDTDRTKQANNIAELTKQTKLNEKKNEELKASLDKERALRNKAVTAAAELENQIEAFKGKIAQLQTEKQELVDKIKKLTTGVGREERLPGVALDGIVKRISKEGYIIISVGKKDGVREGEFFDVFRGTNYVGRINIVQVGNDFSLGREDEAFAKLTKYTIREGDRVANYLGSEVR